MKAYFVFVNNSFFVLHKDLKTTEEMAMKIYENLHNFEYSAINGNWLPTVMNKTGYNERVRYKASQNDNFVNTSNNTVKLETLSFRLNIGEEYQENKRIYCNWGVSYLVTLKKTVGNSLWHSGGHPGGFSLEFGKPDYTRFYSIDDKSICALLIIEKI